MITCNLSSDGVRIEGHAGAAPRGQDIVCAAVSALVETFRSVCRDITIELEDADAVMLAWENVRPEGRGQIRMLYTGLCEIARAYPQNVQVRGEGAWQVYL